MRQPPGARVRIRAAWSFAIFGTGPWRRPYASSIHVMGAGKFFFTGYNIRFLDLNLLRNHLHEMVKMSPLQGYHLDIVPEDQITRVLGAAIAAEQAGEPLLSDVSGSAQR